jgi:charged multivesicular body protein 4
MNLFGKKKTAPVPKLSDSIGQLRGAQEMLDKRERHLAKQIEAAKAEAKEKLKAKDKRGALSLLKRAKMYENQVAAIYGKRENLDLQIMALEAANSNKEIFNVMKAGKDALKAATSQLDVDHVSDVMEEITETMQLQEEVDQQLSQPIGAPLDEEELEAELAQLDEEIHSEALLQKPSAVQEIDLSQAPAVPTKKINVEVKKSEEEEAKELKELEAAMGL